ncbi:MAG: T9SS C-terminal target domain-containing protein [Vicinamibacterales bacterium]
MITSNVMTTILRITKGLAVAVALVLVQAATVRTDQAAPVSVPGIDKPVIVVTGSITGNENWSNSNYYVLRGGVFVRNGAVLNIQAGTRVIGESGSVGTLILERGAKLNAIGTKQQPIVFTSDQPAGGRSRGDWGGIIINGRAPLNVPGGEATGEGDTGVYGGTDPDDDSGILRYVRVEFGGVEFSPDNELNGIAFQAVGRGSTFDYVQAHMSRDDAIEFFGGTADIKHAILSNAADDSLDWTFGWTGRVQFVAITQRGDDADNGIEADNNEFNNGLLPRSNPQIYNMTVCGDPDRNEGPESPRGANLRRGTAFTIRNFLMYGFKSVGMQIENSNTATTSQVDNGTSQMGAGVIWNIPTPLHSSVAKYVSSGVFPNILTNVDPGLSGCDNHENPNFQPSSVATLAGGQLAPILPPNDGFFEVTTFIGAVPPAPEEDWTKGWTAYPQR